jgi:hypothetical protein
VEIIPDILQAVILTISGYLVSQEKSWDVVSRRQPKNFSPAQKGFLERIVRAKSSFAKKVWLATFLPESLTISA